MKRKPKSPASPTRTSPWEETGYWLMLRAEAMTNDEGEWAPWCDPRGPHAVRDSSRAGRRA